MEEKTLNQLNEELEKYQVSYKGEVTRGQNGYGNFDRLIFLGNYISELRDEIKKRENKTNEQ